MAVQVAIAAERFVFMYTRLAFVRSASVDIPKEESIVSVISVGYSDADPDRPTRKSVEEIAKFF